MKSTDLVLQNYWQLVQKESSTFIFKDEKDTEIKKISNIFIYISIFSLDFKVKPNDHIK